MADDKYANAKCFILSPDGYQEITYSELCRRRDTDRTYEDRRFIPLHGMLMEVTPEEYIRFYQEQRRQKYLDERSEDNGDVSVDMFTTDTFNGEDILVDPGEPVDEQAIRQVMVDKLKSCLLRLTKDEMELIYVLFYEGLTERQYADQKGVYHNAVHKKKLRILKKIKKFLES